jgi:predicted nuclease of predicted toxin-antitoxin system
MRFLVDANLSPRVAAGLTSAGFDSVHVTDVGLLTASDQDILDYAAENGLVIVSADTDFGELLALSRGTIRPSAVLLRSADRLTPDQQAALLAMAEPWASKPGPRRPGARPLSRCGSVRSLGASTYVTQVAGVLPSARSLAGVTYGHP